MAHVELLVDHQPVPEPVHPRQVSEGQLDARGAPAHPQVEQLNDAVPGIDQLVLELEGLPGGKPLSPELLDGIVPR